MKCAEFYSPLGFLRLLLKVDTVEGIQMSPKDFKDYANCAKMLKYNIVPFSKVFQLQFVRNEMDTVQFKLSHRDTKFSTALIGNDRNMRHSMQRSGKAKPTESIILSPRVQKTEGDTESLCHLLTENITKD